ncbi:MAG: hypothetical protein E7E18_10960, partial [Eubacterium sp.]|nr:hypothetical protein [Eubacterium sp.]
MQISSNYSMNGVSYENRRRQNDIPQFSTERAKQENESINPYMADTDFNEKVVLVYKCRQKKLNSLYYKKKEQRRCSTWRKIKN